MLSPPTAVVVSGSEASISEALETAELTDPSVLAPATGATIEAQEVKPAVGDTGEAVSSQASLTESSISKETPGEFAVDTPAGELSLAPVGTDANATETPTIVNGSAAVFAGTSPQTDTIVHADALGAISLLQLRSAQAPTSFSWEVRLGANEELQRLSNGSVAVVEPRSGTYLEAPLGSEGPEEPGAESSGEAGEGGYGEEAAAEELNGSLEEQGQFEPLPAAPTTSTPDVEPKGGELHPQDTRAQYENGATAVSAAEAEASGTTLMVIEAPEVMDADGNSVPASLSVEGSAVTLTITPTEHTAYPATAAVGVAASDASADTAKGAEYGL